MNTREPSLQRDNRRNNGDISMGWGADGGMTPARTTREEEEEDDLYGDPMQVDEEEEVPPTQQERYQGIFD
jgi:hypothetical protein